MSRRFVAAAVAGVVLLGAAWMFRYDVKPYPAGQVLVSDRWTGKTQVCDSRKCITLAE